MNISFINPSLMFPTAKAKLNQAGKPLSPLPYDSVSFGAIKRNSLEGFDLACANKFKAPLEKFNSNQDFKNWAKLNYINISNTQNHISRQFEVTEERLKILDTWKKYLDQDDKYRNNPALSLIIYSAITKELEPTNAKIPPILNEEVLSKTVAQINSKITKDNKASFDFMKDYQNNLLLHYSGAEKTEEINGWIKIPSYKNDPDNFKSNVEKLNVMSSSTWCTRTTQGEKYLKDGDFVVYYINGKPKVGIRFIGSRIEEIQGEKNNKKIPLPYLDSVKNYVSENGFKGAEQSINSAMERKKELEKIKPLIQDSLDRKDYATVLKHFNIDMEKLDDGTISLSRYNPPGDLICYDDLGIDETKIFKNVSVIKGKADFKNSDLTDLGALKIIEGDATFSKSKVVRLSNLEEIKGNANFFNSEVKDLGKLEKIGGNSSFEYSKIKTLGNLKSIGGNVGFESSDIEYLGDLKFVGGNCKFDNSKITSLTNLETIGGKVSFEDSQVKDLGRLEFVGKDANFSNSKITNLANLKTIQGSANFRYSNIKNWESVDIQGNIIS